MIYDPVALIMTVCNDFNRKSADALVKQNYPGSLNIYILDDSSREEYKHQIDSFCSENPRVKLIRRKDRKGYKAGSLNNALNNYIFEPYFIQVDADQMITPDFSVKLYEKLMSLPKDVWFVQCSHCQNPQDGFAWDMGPSLSYLWNFFLDMKNKYGFVPNFGHGVIFKRCVWEQVGGYPHLVAEDLSISALGRMHGYRGYYETGIVSGEDFAQSYTDFHRQQYKYVVGAVQFFNKIFPDFLRSKKVSVIEKLDVALSYSSNLLPALVLLYAFYYTLILPYVSAELLVLHISSGVDFAFVVPDTANKLLTRWFLLVSTVMVFSFMMPLMKDLYNKSGLLTLRMLILSMPIYVSRMVPCCIAIFRYFVFREAVFLTTGDQGHKDDISHNTGNTMNIRAKATLVLKTLLDIQKPYVYWLKLGLGIVLSFLCIRTLNFIVLSYALSLIVSFLIFRFGWQNRTVRIISYFPFVVLFSSIFAWGAYEIVTSKY